MSNDRRFTVTVYVTELANGMTEVEFHPGARHSDPKYRRVMLAAAAASLSAVKHGECDCRACAIHAKAAEIALEALGTVATKMEGALQ